MLKSFLRLLVRCFRLAAPYGRRKLALVLAVIFANGLFQVIGVTSVFPFFALAADPARLTHSHFGSLLLSHLPPMSETTLLIWAGVASIALLFISNAISLASEVIRTRYGYGLSHFLRTRLMEALAQRPYSYFLQRNSGTLLQKAVGDVMMLITGVFLPLMESLSRMITLVFLLITIFFVQPYIAIGAAVLLGGFYGTVFMTLRRRSRRLGQEINRANRGVIIAAQQFLGGIKPILVQEKAPYFVGKFAEHSKAQARLYPWVPIFANGPRYLVEPVAFGGLVAVVVLLAASGRTLADVLPNLTVIALACYRMLPSVQLLYAQLSQITAMRYTVDEVEAEISELAESGAGILPAKSDRVRRKSLAKGKVSALNQFQGRQGARPTLEKGARLAFERAIRLDNITFSYPTSKQPVLENFSLEIPKNKSVGIAGVTGCGKTTLVDIILGLHQPQRGAIYIDDHALTPADVVSWRAIIGYVPQDIYLLDASIAENIAFGLPPDEVRKSALREAAKAAQILDFIENGLPARWDTVVGERGVRLSGGQRQRIGLARALYHRPQVLILDEATSALDHQTERAVMDTIYQLQGTLTMITIAHRLTTLERCDRIVRLEGGRIIPDRQGTEVVEGKN